MKKHQYIRAVLASFFIAAGLTLLAGLGLLDQADWNVCDALYQQPAATDNKIVIIGIDQKSLEIYGPYQEWCREGVARTLDILNASPDSRLATSPPAQACSIPASWRQAAASSATISF